MELHEECSSCGRTINAAQLTNGVCPSCQEKQDECPHNSRKYKFTEQYLCQDCGYCSGCKRKDGKYKIDDNPIPEEALRLTEEKQMLDKILDTILSSLKEVNELRRRIQENKR